MSIRLVHCRLQRDRHDAELWNGASFFVEVEKLGAAPDVGVLVEPDLELKCSFVHSSESHEIWACYWCDYGFFPVRYPEFCFTPKCRVNGKTFIDDGGQRGYVVSNLRPWAVGRGRLVLAEAQARRFATGAEYSEFSASVHASIRQLLPSPDRLGVGILFWGWIQEAITRPEKVGVRYTTDGWQNHETILAARLGEGSWFFSHFIPLEIDALEFKAGCLHGGRLDWDDYFGRNYFLVVG